MISDQIFTVFDTETTGFNPKEGAKIVEIAGIKMKGDKILENETFEFLVNPGIPIPLEVQKIHGIDDDMVANASPISEVLPKFMEFAGDSVLVAHNAEFDMAFVNEEMFQLNPFYQSPRVLCTKLLSRKLRPNEKFHNLDTLSYRYGLPKVEEGRHRALTDVFLLAAVFQKLLSESSVNTIEELLKIQ